MCDCPPVVPVLSVVPRPCQPSWFPTLHANLSILWPTRNAQERLREDVERLLDIVTDSARHCEVLILDDGSDDLTFEVALELARSYPQVKAAGWRHQLGLDVTVRRGLQRTSASTVLLHSPQPAPTAADLRVLWRLCDEHERTIARVDGGQPGLRHLLRSCQAAEDSEGPFFLLRGVRNAGDLLPRELDPQRAIAIGGLQGVATSPVTAC